MSLPDFKIGDQVLYDNRVETTIERISVNSHGKQVLWGYWKYLNSDRRGTSMQFAMAERCTLMHPQLKYDPMQQGDKDEDI